MKLKDAVSRIAFTISKSNKPNNNDAIAFDSIIDFLNKTQEETIQQNLLFAKLYTLVLKDFTEFYGDVDFANKQVNKELSMTLDFHIEKLLMQLKSSELKKHVTDECLKNKPPEKVLEKLKEYPSVLEKFISTWDFWDKENVISHLNTNITLSIHNFKNHV